MLITLIWNIPITEMTAAPGSSQGSGKQGPERGGAGHRSEMRFYVSNTAQEGTGQLSRYSSGFFYSFDTILKGCEAPYRKSASS